MRKIAIFASGSGDSARRVSSFFSEGNRISVEMIVTNNQDDSFAESFTDSGATVATFADEMFAERPEDILGILKGRGVELLAIDKFGLPLPEVIQKEYAERIVMLNSPDVAPNAIVDAFTRIDSEGTGKRNADPDKPKTVDEEWAETLKMDYDPEQVRATPPPVPGAHPATPASETIGGKNAPGASFRQNQQDGRGFQQNAGVQSNYAQGNAEPMPPTYLVWSVICTVLCCLIPGIVAIIFSSQVSSRYFGGDIEGARRASRNAEIWIIVSFVLGVLSSTLYLPIMLIA